MTATRTRRVLSVQPVAERGGSDHALLAMIRQLARDGWDCHVAMPGPSPMEQEFAAAGATLHIVAMRRLTLSGGLSRRVAYVLGWPGTVAAPHRPRPADRRRP